ITQHIWFYQGLLLVERRIDHDACVKTVLNDNSESGHAASLTIDKNGGEWLLQAGDEWKKSADGQVERRVLYRPDEPGTKQTDEVTRLNTCMRSSCDARNARALWTNREARGGRKIGVGESHFSARQPDELLVNCTGTRERKMQFPITRCDHEARRRKPSTCK